MRAPLVALIVAFAGAPATAAWVEVVATGDTRYDLDPASVTAAVAGVRRAVVLQDYAATQADRVRSRGVSYEIDCAGERLRSVAATGNAEPMGQQRSVNAWASTSEWLYVAQRTGSSIARPTPYRAVVKAACAR